MLKLSACLLIVCAGAIVLWRSSSLGAGELAKHSSLDKPAVKSAVQSLQSAQEGSDMNALKAGIA
ncbi:MAG: hypothetical protein ACKVHE_35850, partial [Planctomycetales bacterium]